MTEKVYQIPNDSELDNVLAKAEELKNQINSHKPLKNGLWGAIQNKLRIDWTYNSNAIEGSTLTHGETIFFLQEGLTVEGKPLKDFLDARNHADAIEFLMDVIKNERQISTGLIKEINSLLLSDIRYTDAINQFGKNVKKATNVGGYKIQPNHVLQTDNTIHYYVEPVHVPAQMEELCQWINNNINTVHPIITAAIAHYNFVRIHPFDDGNGRGSRILMNLILIRKGYNIAIVKNERRRKYIECLKQADNGNILPFTIFIANSLIETQNTILEEITKLNKI